MESISQLVAKASSERKKVRVGSTTVRSVGRGAGVLVLRSTHVDPPIIVRTPPAQKEEAWKSSVTAVTPL